MNGEHDSLGATAAMEKALADADVTAQPDGAEEHDIDDALSDILDMSGSDASGGFTNVEEVHYTDKIARAVEHLNTINSQSEEFLNSRRRQAEGLAESIADIDGESIESVAPVDEMDQVIDAVESDSAVDETSTRVRNDDTTSPVADGDESSADAQESELRDELFDTEAGVEVDAHAIRDEEPETSTDHVFVTEEDASVIDDRDMEEGLDLDDTAIEPEPDVAISENGDGSHEQQIDEQSDGAFDADLDRTADTDSDEYTRDAIEDDNGESAESGFDIKGFLSGPIGASIIVVVALAVIIGGAFALLSPSGVTQDEAYVPNDAFASTVAQPEITAEDPSNAASVEPNEAVAQTPLFAEPAREQATIADNESGDVVQNSTAGLKDSIQRNIETQVVASAPEPAIVIKPQRTVETLQESPSSVADEELRALQNGVDRNTDAVVAIVGKMQGFQNAFNNVVTEVKEIRRLQQDHANTIAANTAQIKDLVERFEAARSVRTQAPAVNNIPAQVKTIEAKPAVRKIRYKVVVSRPGVAFLMSKRTGKPVRIEVGDSLIGYGRVVSIDAYGRIMTESGLVEVM